MGSKLFIGNVLPEESLSQRKLCHRYQADTFLPLIPPQTFCSAEKQASSFKALSQIKQETLSCFDSIFWSQWKEIETILEMTGGDIQEAFLKFVEEDYYVILDHAVMSYESSQVVAATVPLFKFTPLVPVDFEASSDQINERQ